MPERRKLPAVGTLCWTLVVDRNHKDDTNVTTNKTLRIKLINFGFQLIIDEQCAYQLNDKRNKKCFQGYEWGVLQQEPSKTKKINLHQWIYARLFLILKFVKSVSHHSKSKLCFRKSSESKLLNSSQNGCICNLIGITK